MTDIEDLDEMTGQSPDWEKKRLSATPLERITPVQHNTKEGGPKGGFTAGKAVAPDPENDEVKATYKLIQEGKYAAAFDIWDRGSWAGGEYMFAFIDECEKHGGLPSKGDWIFMRRIQRGSKGPNLQVEMGWNPDGSQEVVTVPKDLVYRVNGRAWKPINDHLPKDPTGGASVEAPASAEPLTPAVSGASVVSDDDPAVGSADANPLPDSASNPEGSSDAIPPVAASGRKAVSGEPGSADPPKGSSAPLPKEDDLIPLIGANSVELLNELGLRDSVKTAKQNFSTFKIIDGKARTPIMLIGDDDSQMKISSVLSDSNFGPTNATEDAQPFSSDNMGAIIYEELRRMLRDKDKEGGREQQIDNLRKIRKHMDSLSRVFGFDDPNQLEAFFCAWLMKDSTCRLTGIPGTGKTTVINSAATLLSNSYGYYEGRRYYAEGTIEESAWGEPHIPILFPAGQSYDVNYGDKAYQGQRRLWEQWRFSDWNLYSKKSGSYVYDFRFLQRNSDAQYQKLPMTPEAFADLLFAEPAADGLIRAKPVSKKTIEDLFRLGSKKAPTQVVEDNTGNAHWRKSALWTDSGANEGFDFREFLLEHFYDSRLDDESNGLSLISDEMLNECGVAKIDYDKRAEEILYGIEIRQITEKQIVGGKEQSVAAYQFDPTPRKVVTQPIKFFNEANRSGSGVEDAILGLIAEKTVEYRGQTFKSPSFVAWMDTNPHQKGNDLAFVDRIDMELYFGTLTLGGRFNTLAARYGSGARGTAPEYQLIERMLNKTDSSDYIRPMRFHELKNAWDIINGSAGKEGIPFNASGISDAESGALLDISLLSVLFTQRYMTMDKKTKDIGGKKHTLKDDDDVYASPLVDISTTTNLQYETQYEQNLEKYMGEKPQAPVFITRMLGFRFTNSLIKMTRAMAFLRGKDHVTRQEVLDALPYCIAHRLGPAREGEDPKGRDIGIDRDAMVFTNEQKFIKDLIVNGYILRNTKSLLGDPGGSPSLLDIWDAFLRNCRSKMDSTDSYWKYEDNVLLGLKELVRQGGATITPVHWSIATMIVENERKKVEYKERYHRYLERISRPSAKTGSTEKSSKEKKEEMIANHSASQYFAVRGAITQDSFLFSDDREKLLSLVDSKIEAICGATLMVTPDAIISNPTAVVPATDYTKKARGGPNATQFKWRTYGDGMGAWGRMITNSKNTNVQIAKLGVSGENFLNVSGADYEANQTIALTGVFTIPKKGESTANDDWDSKFSNVFDAFKNHVQGGGNQFGATTTGDFGIIKELPNLEAYQVESSATLNDWLGGSKAADTILKDGFMACFKLDHYTEGVPASMKTIIEGEEKDIEGDDNLRLWLRLKVVEGANTAGSQATIGFFIGITSACMKPSTNGYVIVDMESDEDYESANYGDISGQATSGFQDVGNMTIEDLRGFTQDAMAKIVGAER